MAEFQVQKINKKNSSWLCSCIFQPKNIYIRAITNAMSMNWIIITKVTPLIMFWTWLQMVRTVASSFLLPHHLSTRSLEITGETQISKTRKQSWYFGLLYFFNHFAMHQLDLKLYRQPLSSPYLFVLLAQKAKLQVDVVELPDEFATGSLDSDCPPLQPNLDC